MEIIPLDGKWIKSAAALEQLCFSQPWTEEGLRQSIEQDGTVFIAAIQGDELLGYAGMNLVLGEGYLNNIAVFPNHRGKGIATALLNRLISHCTEFLSLEVRASNTVARSLYKGLGFCEAGIRKSFYQYPTEDGVIYTIYINPAINPK